MIDLGFSRNEYAAIIKGVGLAATLIGGFAGGFVARAYSLPVSLWIGGSCRRSPTSRSPGRRCVGPQCGMAHLRHRCRELHQRDRHRDLRRLSLGAVPQSAAHGDAIRAADRARRLRPHLSFVGRRLYRRRNRLGVVLCDLRAGRPAGAVLLAWLQRRGHFDGLGAGQGLNRPRHSRRQGYRTVKSRNRVCKCGHRRQASSAAGAARKTRKKSFCKDQDAHITRLVAGYTRYLVAFLEPGCARRPVMDMILVKIFATALALSEVTTAAAGGQDAFRSGAGPGEVVQILRDGCAHMRQAFDIESINLDDLIATALDDPKAVGADIKAFHGINFADLNTAYHQFCKNETVANPVVDLGQVIDFFNNAAADLPDQTRLKGRKLPSMSVVLDGKGGNFADVFEPGNRRVWVPLADIPELVQKAFVAAEDRRFYQHHGVDERGIIRAFIGNLADPGRPQGGSTITQQVVKNLLVGDDVTYERKIREMIVASRLEKHAEQERNSRALSEFRLSRPRLLGRRDGRAQLFRQIGEGSHAARRRDAGRPAQGAELTSIRTAIRIAPRNGSPMCSAACRKTASSPRSRRIEALAAPPKLVAFEHAAARQRLSLRRFPRPRGENRRRREPDGATPTPCTRPSTRNCSATPKRRCRKGLRATRLSTGRDAVPRA